MTATSGSNQRDLTDLTVVEVADAIARGEVTAVSVTEACLARIARLDPVLNATIWIEAQASLEAAAEADRRRAQGAPIGPLHGVPMAHKDMYYQAGRRCTCGSAIRGEFRPDYTATVIERLEAAGAITLGGLNMAEFAQNPTGHNNHYGDCRNPWRLDYITAGSSSGSGAAIAARLVYASLGSDTGGSVRVPASACGVTGLKPTQTRVSRHGAMPLSFSCDNVGPLARSARDCARVMRVIAGADPRDPTCSHEAVPDYEAALDGDLRGFRIGVPEGALMTDVDPAVQQAFDAALAVLRERGATVQRVTLPVMDEVQAYSAVVSRSEGTTAHRRWMRERQGDYAPHLSARIYPGFAIPAAFYIEAMNRRGAVLRAFSAGVFAKVDLLAMPTIARQIPTRDETNIETGGVAALQRYGGLTRNTRWLSYLGLPAISAPCGFDENGLPVGLQLVGRPFGEGRLLRAADAMQRDTDWHLAAPVLG
ncbi:MAG: amidase [Burkholderiales bacterium]|nr:amidase [Burkholderiales bacterium]